MNKTVYPRGCGELNRRRSLGYEQDGLSPWVRGTRFAELFVNYNSRFIPVGAGNSISLSSDASLRSGLSPWVRGTLGKSVMDTAKERFIPVGAGNSECERC